MQGHAGCGGPVWGWGPLLSEDFQGSLRLVLRRGGGERGYGVGEMWEQKVRTGCGAGDRMGWAVRLWGADCVGSGGVGVRQWVRRVFLEQLAHWYWGWVSA